MKRFLWIFGLLLLLALDLFTKWLAERHLAEPVPLVEEFLKLNIAYNPGVAFSISIPNSVMIFLTPVLLALVVWLISRSINMKSRLSQLVLALMIAGGLGNFINRVFEGAVIDFIDFSFWPSFNLADSYLVASALLIIIFHGKIIKA